MPVIFGTTLLTAVVDIAAQTISCTGRAFGLDQDPISDIEYSPTTLGLWASVDAITTWGDESANGTYLLPLAAGIYDVRITSSDGEQSTLVGAFIVPLIGRSRGESRCYISASIGI